MEGVDAVGLVESPAVVAEGWVESEPVRGEVGEVVAVCGGLEECDLLWGEGPSAAVSEETPFLVGEVADKLGQVGLFEEGPEEVHKSPTGAGGVVVKELRYSPVDLSAGGRQAGQVLDGGNLRAGASTDEPDSPGPGLGLCGEGVGGVAMRAERRSDFPKDGIGEGGETWHIHFAVLAVMTVGWEGLGGVGKLAFVGGRNSCFLLAC